MKKNHIKGRTDLLLRWGIFSGLLTVLSFVIGLPWGILGVTAAYAVMSILLSYPSFAIPFRLIGLKMSGLGSALWRPAVCSAVMYGAVVAAVSLAPAGMPGWLTLCLLVPLGAIVYSACAWVSNRALLLEVISMVRGRK